MTSKAAADDSSQSGHSEDDDEEYPDNRSIFYDEVVQLLKQSHSDATFYSHAVSEIDSLRLSSGVQPKDVAQCVMQGVVLLPLEIHPPKPFNVQLQEVLKRFKVLIGHFNKWRDSQSNYEAGAKEGLETLIKRGVLTSKDDALHLLDVIQRETALRFSNLAIAIQAGAYDAMMKELLSVRSMLNLPPNVRQVQEIQYPPKEETTQVPTTPSSSAESVASVMQTDSQTDTRTSQSAHVPVSQPTKHDATQVAEQHDDPFSVDWDLADKRNAAVERQLKKRELVMVKVVGDGNCFFRAICVITGRNEDEHLALRKVIAKQMYDDAPNSHMLLFGESEEAIRRHAEDVAVENTWVGEDVILATAAHFRRPIHVFIAVDSCSPLVYGSSTEQSQQPLLVAFQEPGHYNAVKRK